jgi:hypothetical protein
MKDWILKQIISYIMANLTKEKVEELLKQLDGWAKPKIIAKKDELFAWIDAQVADTATPIDDVIAKVVKQAIEYYIK